MNNTAIGAAMQGILTAFRLLGIGPSVENVIAMFLLAASKLDAEARASVFASVDNYLSSPCDDPNCPFHGTAATQYGMTELLAHTSSELSRLQDQSSETLDDDTLQRMFDSTPDVPTIEAKPGELASDFDEYDDIAEGLGIDRSYLYDDDDDE